MSLARWTIMIAATVVLLALLTWQQLRQRDITRCLESGGLWDGPNSRCVAPARPMLQRDIYRS